MIKNRFMLGCQYLLSILIVTLATNANAAVVLGAADDAYVKKESGLEHLNESTLNVKKSAAGTARETFLKFDVSHIKRGITSAKIRLYASAIGDSATSGDQLGHTLDVKLTDSASWTETTSQTFADLGAAGANIVWDNKPNFGTALDSIDVNSKNQWFEFDVSAAITTGGIYSFAITTDNTPNGSFTTFISSDNSGEHKRPQLILTLDSPSITVKPSHLVLNSEFNTTFGTNGEGGRFRTVTLTNSGSSDLTGLTVTAGAGLDLGTKTCASTQVVSSTCTFKVKFNADASNPTYSSVVIASNELPDYTVFVKQVEPGQEQANRRVQPIIKNISVKVGGTALVSTTSLAEGDAVNITFSVDGYDVEYQSVLALYQCDDSQISDGSCGLSGADRLLYFVKNSSSSSNGGYSLQAKDFTNNTNIGSAVKSQSFSINYSFTMPSYSKNNIALRVFSKSNIDAGLGNRSISTVAVGGQNFQYVENLGRTLVISPAQ